MDEIIAGAPSQDDRNLSMIAHLLGMFTSFVGALVIWLIKKDESPFIEKEAKEALNFQITLLIGHMIAGVLSIVLIGFLLFPLIWLVNVIFSILAAVAASKGQAYRYPFAIRLIS
ncbi:MAG TPA: DUF4870 domain-containing protein [Burkholderiaceae bacterium]|jgi:uncharacterized Tic20 family protein|nr:DUF4870 domain-containing protein [Burkholderiaceae bacterium]